jgi:hypothetical protein
MKKLTLTIAVLAIAGLSSAALNIANANFDDDSAWTWGDSNTAGGWGAPSGNAWDASGVGTAFVNTTAGGGYSVVYQSVNLGGGIGAGDTVTMSAFVTDLTAAGENTALLKLESLDAGGGVIGGSDIEHVFTASAAGATESWDYTIHGDAVGVKVVFGVTGGWGGPLAGDSSYSFDNIQVVPEPATMGLIGLFGGGMMALRRFRIC